MPEFKDQLRRLRKEIGYNQGQLADRLGISRSAISMYESGRRQPDYETLELFADFFNVDMNYLLGKTDMSTYYIDPETARIADEIKNNKDLKLLFSEASTAQSDDIRTLHSLLLALKKKEGGE